ncbi:MAG: hypothetical protein ABI461_12710 [Polyangiaceae bacterium]
MTVLGLVAQVMLSALVIVACRGGAPPAGPDSFASCADPRITPFERLTLDGTDPIHQKLAAHDNRARSAAQADTFLATARLSTLEVGRPSLPAGRSDRDVIDAFVRATDFSRQDLVFVEDMFNGFTDGLAGEAIRGHQVALVDGNCIGSGGGAPVPQISWVAVYRVPKNFELVRVGCGTCPPPVACCPP